MNCEEGRAGNALASIECVAIELSKELQSVCFGVLII